MEVFEAVFEALLELLVLRFEFRLEVLDGFFEPVEGLLGPVLDVLVGFQQGVDPFVESVEGFLDFLIRI